MKTRIIGLGNPIITDEAAGLHAARRIAERLAENPPAGEVDVVESEVGGLNLLDLMTGWDRVFVLDAVQMIGVEPGSLLVLSPDDELPSMRLRYVHEVDLPTALALGAELGRPIPSEVVIFGIQAENARTFGDQLTPVVAAAVSRLVDEVMTRLAANS